MKIYSKSFNTMEPQVACIVKHRELNLWWSETMNKWVRNRKDATIHRPGNTVHWNGELIPVIKP